VREWTAQGRAETVAEAPLRRAIRAAVTGEDPGDVRIPARVSTLEIHPRSRRPWPAG